jgi:hypothetical protein
MEKLGCVLGIIGLLVLLTGSVALILGFPLLSALIILIKVSLIVGMVLIVALYIAIFIAFLIE